MDRGAFRFRVSPPAGLEPDEALALALGEVTASWAPATDGSTTVWVDAGDAPDVAQGLEREGFGVLEAIEEPPRDWVSEAAALQRPVAVGTLLLDPHDGERAAASPGRRRLFLPAETAFGTGSHESTRLALRLLLRLPLGGRAVLDVGCGAGTLAFAARCVGAGRVLGLDTDPDAAVASRRNAGRNALSGCTFLAGPLAALGEAAFDVVVANMLEEEVVPLLGDVRRLLSRGGTLVTAGQLVVREAPFLATLRGAGFAPFRLAAEGEWLGTVSSRA